VRGIAGVLGTLYGEWSCCPVMISNIEHYEVEGSSYSMPRLQKPKMRNEIGMIKTSMN
jgi:hypothetical protein